MGKHENEAHRMNEAQRMRQAKKEGGEGWRSEVRKNYKMNRTGAQCKSL